MSTSKYHPSLMIMAKTKGFGYLNSTDVITTSSAATASTEVYADDDAGRPPPNQAEMIELLETMDEVSPVKKPRTELKKSQQALLGHTAGFENLSAVWDNCSSEEIAQYKDWYVQANEDCRNLAAKPNVKTVLENIKADDHIRTIIAVVAATSQGTLWEENLELAERIILDRDLLKNFKVTKEKEQDEDGEEAHSADNLKKITQNNLEKVMNILSGNFSVLETDKFGAFNQSIWKPESSSNVVVVDTHAAGMWLGKRLGVQSPEFQKAKPVGFVLAKIVMDYRKLAKKVGYSAQSVQAITWSVWRRLPPNYLAEILRTAPSGDAHPEVRLFQAFYPYLYASDIKGGKKNWRWRYDRFDDLMRPDDLSNQSPWGKGHLCEHEIKPAKGDKKAQKCGIEVIKNGEEWTHVNPKDDEEAQEAGRILDSRHEAKPGPEQKLKSRLGPNDSKSEWDLAKKLYKDAMPAPQTPEEFRAVVQKYGANLHKYYGFPAKPWGRFLQDNPGILQKLQEKHVAAMMETAARKIIGWGL